METWRSFLIRLILFFSVSPVASSSCDLPAQEVDRPWTPVGACTTDGSCVAGCEADACCPKPDAGAVLRQLTTDGSSA